MARRANSPIIRELFASGSYANRTLRDVPLSRHQNDCSPEDSFGRLIEAARGGDRHALAELVDSCRDYLLLVANQDLHDDLRAKLGASDLVQETLMSAHNAFDGFEGNSRSEFLAWLRGILKNDLLEAHRHYKGVQKRQVDREAPMDDTRRLGANLKDYAHTPGTRAVANEEAKLLAAAMEQLSAEHRQVLEFRNWQQMSFSEIGARMNRSEDASRKLWARAVVQLQNALKTQQPE